MHVPTSTETAVKHAQEEIKAKILLALLEALHDGKTLAEAIKLVKLM